MKNTPFISKLCLILIFITIGIGAKQLFADSMDGSGSSVYSGGDGTAANPYQIGSVADWQELMATSADWGKHFILTANINLTGLTFTQAPIAPDTEIAASYFQGTQFTGFFDGNGHTISNLTIATSIENFIGLFGYIGSDGEIKNLSVVDANIQGVTFVGGLCGWNDGTIKFCYSTGTVSGRHSVGGLVGWNNGTGVINASYSTCASSISIDNYQVGGLVGVNAGAISNCYSTGSASGSGYVGGLVSENYGGKISNCYATGTVGGGSHYIGGFVGCNSGVTITNCFWDTQTSDWGIGVGNGSAAGVTGKTTSDMQTLATFIAAGWDFVGETANGTEDFWVMPESGGYPVFAIWSTNEPASVSVLKPNGGESLTSGKEYLVEWSSTGNITEVLIEYSVDGGLNWFGAAPANTGNSGSYNWLVPFINSSGCLVRISDAALPAIYDTSDNVFEIYEPVLSVIQPNGGERLQKGSDYNIIWSSNLPQGSVFIEYSADSGGSWQTIATTDDTGSYNWQITGPESGDYLIRVSDANGVSVSDTSDNFFAVYNIDFVTIDNAGNAADTQVMIDGTTGYGAVGYDYRIGKNEITNSQWNIFIAYAGIPMGNDGCYTTSAQFTGAQQPTNNVSWYEAAQFCNWLTSGDKSKGAYQFSGNNVNPCDFLGIDRAAAQAVYGTIYVIPTENEWYKAAYYTGNGYSVYANGLSITPEADNGWNLYGGAYDTLWDVGTGTQELNGTFDMMGNVWEWNESPVSDGAVERIRRGGSFDDPGIPDSPASYIRYARIYLHPDTEIYDVGFRVASITAPSPLSLHNPNGGESICAGTTYTIEWSSTGSISDILIEYSTNNGQNWRAISPPNIGNTGSYGWPVPMVDSQECLIRISDAANSSISDISDKCFAVYITSNKYPGDLNSDGTVDYEDLFIFAGQWLQPPGDPNADIAPNGGDGIVNFLDFTVLANDWGRDSTIVAQSIFGYCIATKGPLLLADLAAIDGNETNPLLRVEGDVYIEGVPGTIADSLSMIGLVSVAGEVSIYDPNASYTIGSKAVIGGAAPGEDDYITTGADFVDFPIPYPKYFEEFATGNVINSANKSTYSSCTEFVNCLIEAGTDFTFASDTVIKGLLYIKSPNKIQFTGKVTVIGSVVCEGDYLSPISGDSVDFAGRIVCIDAATLAGTKGFEELSSEDLINRFNGTFLLAPGFKAEFSGQANFVNGVIAANGVSFSGQAGGIVQGSIINYSYDTMTVSSQSELVFIRSGREKNPAGFVPEGWPTMECQALQIMTTAIRTADFVVFGDAANQCTIIDADGNSYTYIFRSGDKALYLIDNDNSKEYLLCGNVSNLNFTKTTGLVGEITAVKSVQISMSVTIGSQTQTFNADVVVIRNMI